MIDNCSNYFNLWTASCGNSGLQVMFGCPVDRHTSLSAALLQLHLSDS